MNNIKRIKEVSVLQHDSTDCGAACISSAIRYFGGNAGIEKIRRLSGTNQAGTTLLGLYQAAKEYGMEATGYDASVKDILSYDGILILHVTPEKGYDHYLMSYGFSNGRFVIWDPAKGLSFKTPSELEEIWLSHKCLAVSPGKDFIHENTAIEKKRRWVADIIKPDFELLVSSVFVGIIISGLGVVMAVYSQKLLDRILPSGDVKMLVVSIILVLLLLCVRVILTAVRQSMLLSQGKSFNIRIVDGFYSSLLGLPKPFFDTRKTGDMVARLNDTMRIQRVISDVVSTYVIDILIVIITLVVILIYSFVAGIVSTLALPLFFLLIYWWNKPIIKSQQELMAGYAINESNFINTLRGITEIKSMNWESFYASRNKSIFSMFQERSFSLGKIQIQLGMITNLTGALYLIGLLYYTSIEVMGTRMTQGELMAIISLSSTLLPSVMNLALVSIPLNEAKVAIERMFEFTHLNPEKEGENTDGRDTQISKISLDKVTFRFPGQKLLFSDVSLQIEKGRVTALVGESGSGKSTIVNILMRFYQPESGFLKVNDVEGTHELPLDFWRRSVTLVPQEIHLFNGTVLENIIPDADEMKLRKLAILTIEYGLDQFVKSLPLGFATLTGEEGVKLSGGQKQVIAFMRALINDPDIILIDEGTSGMDRDTEAIILNILGRIKESVGVLLVTHRINLVKKLCDRIYLLEGKTITASGTHYELVSGDNLYQRYWNDFN